MQRRRVLLALGGSALGPLAARAQTAKGPAEIAILYPGAAAGVVARLDPLRQGLHGAGLAEGRDYALVPVSADGDVTRLDALARELAARPVRVLIAVARAATQAARQATTTIPIVVVDLETDPVAEGMVASLARPGRNLTGIFFNYPEFSAKWLQMLAETIPGLQRLAVFWDPRTGPEQIVAMRKTAAAQRLALIELHIGEAPSLAAAFERAGREAQAGMLLSTPVIVPNAKLIADLALRNRLPTISMFPEFADAGGLIAYGPSVPDLFQQLGALTGKILKGTAPGELPIERPFRVIMAVNLDTAKALGLSLPAALLARADKVVE